MLQDLFHISLSPFDFAVRAIVVYLSVLLLLRVGGKRQMGQMSPTEFVSILLISNAVQNSMNGGDNSLLGGLLLATILIITSTLVTYLTFKSRRWAILFEGTPTLLIHHGEVLRKNLNRERITPNELKILLRKQGIHKLSDVAEAVLEADGTLSITHAEANAISPMSTS